MSNLFKVIFHAIVMALLFAIPVLLAWHPAFLDYTVGGLLNAFYLWLISTKASPSGLGFRTKYRY